MANAKPVTSKPEEEEVITEVSNDQRRPNPEAEAPVSKPKTVTVKDDGTVVEEY